MRRRSLSRRLVLQIAAAVALAIAAAATVTFLVVRNQLRDGVDSSLVDRAEAARIVALRDGMPLGGTAVASAVPVRDLAKPPGPPPAPRPGVVRRRDVIEVKPDRADLVPLPARPPSGRLRALRPAVVVPPAGLSGPSFLIQVVDRTGTSRAVGSDGGEIAVQPEDVAVARGETGEFFSEREVSGVPVRVLTSQIGPGTALQVARPLAEVDHAVSGLLLVLIAVTLAGTGVAALLGVAVSRRALRPIRELTDEAEGVAATRDLSRRIEGAPEGEEIDRLRASFNRMLLALERSVEAQRGLVADASHELRTPLTSLRSNIELLERAPAMSAGERRRLMAEVEEELLELGRLVDDVVELAREGAEELRRDEVRLDEVAAAAVERARRRAGAPGFVTELEPTVICGDGARLDRAVSNLLDNAAAWAPTGDAVEVRLAGGVLSVRDHGPGIDPAELPRVFDRFYRSPTARGKPGSGLGLAIVQRTAEQHGGRAEARNAPGGGAELRLVLPGAAPAPIVGEAHERLAIS